MKSHRLKFLNYKEYWSDYFISPTRKTYNAEIWNITAKDNYVSNGATVPLNGN